MTTIVSCHNLNKIYGKAELQVHAVNAVNLEIDKGDFISVSGPSGSGKTTLLNLIGGLDQADSGEIIVDHQTITQMTKSELADLRLNKIGFVFQAYNLIPVLSAYENIEFIMQLQGIDATERRQRAKAILQEVGLSGLGDRRPAQLSGGQQQRIAVARAIVSKPSIVLADEPTANLDSHTSDELLNIMQHLNQQHDITFIIASHDPKVIAFTRRRIHMVDGKIEQDENN